MTPPCGTQLAVSIIRRHSAGASAATVAGAACHWHLVSGNQRTRSVHV